MADEKPTTEVPAEAVAAKEPAVDADGELIPPPQIRKPSRDGIKEKEDAVKADMDVLDKQIKVVSDKLKSLQQASSGQNDGLSETRSKLKELKGKRESLISQRAAIYGARDAARESRDAKMSEMKDLKSQTKFKDVGSIDAEIKKKETLQNTTSMTLAKEKEVLKEIDDLKKQRKVLAQHMSVASDLDGGKAATADHGASIKQINEELTGIKGEMDKLQAELNKFYDKKNDSQVPKLRKEMDELRDKKRAKSEEIQKLWDGFKEANKVWKDNQVEWDKYKKVRAVKDKAEYEARKEAAKKAREEEMAKKTPYEEEMALCDYLVNYLTTTFLAEKKEEEAAKPEVALPSEFEGMKLNKKSSGDYLGATGKKGPKKKGGAKNKAGTKRGKIVIFPETMESFGLLKMEPPSTVEQVSACVEALKTKKTEFSSMPRGQVLSIAEMNYKYEMEADERRPRRDDAKPKGNKGGDKGKKLDIASTELFPSLGGAKPAAAAGAAETKE